MGPEIFLYLVGGFSVLFIIFMMTYLFPVVFGEKKAMNIVYDQYKILFSRFILQILMFLFSFLVFYSNFDEKLIPRDVSLVFILSLSDIYTLTFNDNFFRTIWVRKSLRTYYFCFFGNIIYHLVLQILLVDFLFLKNLERTDLVIFFTIFIFSLFFEMEMRSKSGVEEKIINTEKDQRSRLTNCMLWVAILLDANIEDKPSLSNLFLLVTMFIILLFAKNFYLSIKDMIFVKKTPVLELTYQEKKFLQHLDHISDPSRGMTSTIDIGKFAFLNGYVEGVEGQSVSEEFFYSQEWKDIFLKIEKFYFLEENKFVETEKEDYIRRELYEKRNIFKDIYYSIRPSKIEGVERVKEEEMEEFTIKLED